MLKQKLSDVLYHMMGIHNKNKEAILTAGFLNENEIKKLIDDFNMDSTNKLQEFETLSPLEDSSPPVVNTYIALVLSKVSPKEKIKYLQNPVLLDITIILNAKEIIEEYLKSPDNLNPELHLTLNSAIKVGNLEIFKLLLAKKIAQPNTYFHDLFNYAIEQRQISILNFLSKLHPVLYTTEKQFEENHSLIEILTQLERHINSQLVDKNQQDKANDVLNRIKALNNEGKTSKIELYITAKATYDYLKGDITSQQYQKLAQEIEGHSSLKMRLLGIAMMALGVLAIVAGVAVAVTTPILTIPATIACSSLITIGTGALAAGVGLFSGSFQRGLADTVDKLHHAVEDKRSAPST